MKINYIIEKSYNDESKHIWTYVNSYDIEEVEAAIEEYDDYVKEFPNVVFRLVKQTVEVLKTTRL